MKEPIISIPNASEAIINKLIDLGILYVGNDNELHVVDNIKEKSNERKN